MLFGTHPYRNKRILITGHTGFKGSWLSLWLSSMNGEVAGFSLPRGGTKSHLDFLGLSIREYEGNLFDQSKVKKVLHDFRPQVIFHLAAQPIVWDAIQRPASTFETNVMGTIYLYEAIRACESVETLVSVSSDKVYAPDLTISHFHEDHPLGGVDPYSASKSAMEIISRSYWESYFRNEGRVKMATCRCGNVIGGGDWHRSRIVPDMLISHFQRKKLTVTTPNAVRPWIHVLDALKGYLLVGEKLIQKDDAACTSFNFGPDQTSSVRDLVELSKKHLPYLDCDYAHGKDTSPLSLDSSKAKKILGWNCSQNLESALIQTIEWYRSFYDHQTIETHRQLAQYSYSAK